MSSSGCSESAVVVDRGVPVADLGEPGRHRRHREVLGRDLGELVPRQRCRHRRARLGPDAVGRGDRAVARVLVVVDEDPLAALLLPPLGGHLAGEAALQLASERDRGVADVGERPARLDPHVDVDAAAAGGLREADVAELVEQRPRLAGDPHGVVEVGARLRVEVEAQLVRMVDVVAAHGPRVKRDRPHLRRPADHRNLGRADLVGVTARRELDARGLDVLGGALGDPLLEERVAAAPLARGEHDPGMHALGPALERRRPAPQRAHDPVLRPPGSS